MDQRPAARSAVRRWRPWPDRHDVVWHQWVVPASSEQVRAALTRAATPRLTLSPDEVPGTLTDASRRWRATWRDGRHEGDADVELTRLSPHATLVELSLWPTAGGRSPLGGRRRRDRVAAQLAHHLGVTRTAARPAGQPAIIRLMSPRPAGLPVVGWVALVALLLTPAVWAFVAAQGPTPVTEERALAEHRERVQQLTTTRESVPTDDEGETGDDDPQGAEVESTDEDDAPSREEKPDEESGVASPDQEAGQVAGTGDADEAAPAEDEPESQDQDTSEERPRGPEEGVYQYATDGGEGVAVPNGSREYPERTTISVTEDGCGYVERWSVLDERWDERETCTGDEAGLASQTSFREFFGVEQEHRFVCDEQQPPGEQAQEPGASWEITCEAEDTRLDGTIEVVGLEVLEVGGTEVPTVHLRLDGEVSGDLEGRQQTERWVAPDHGGLLIREESQTRATVSSPMGDVDYREDYRLDLLSLRPRS